MWGIIPAAGLGSRIQPLAFSKELLPVGSRFDGEVGRPRAVSEYLVERMILGDADKICTVTFCFTPESCGVAPHHTNPPTAVGEYTEFCARMVERYAR